MCPSHKLDLVLSERLISGVPDKLEGREIACSYQLETSFTKRNGLGKPDNFLATAVKQSFEKPVASSISLSL